MSDADDMEPRAWLAEGEVRPILNAYDETMLDRAHELMCRAADEDEGWREAIDNKAYLVLGFAAAMTTAAAAWFSADAGAAALAVLGIGIVALVLAVAFAFEALRTRKWPTWADSAILPTTAGLPDDRDHAKRYWIEAMFRRHKRIELILRTKARHLGRAQLALVVGVIVVSLAGLFVLFHPYLPYPMARHQPAACQLFSAAAVESASVSCPAASDLPRRVRPSTQAERRSTTALGGEAGTGCGAPRGRTILQLRSSTLQARCRTEFSRRRVQMRIGQR